MNRNIICVVLSGGIGSRLWPESRETFPKPFISLLNEDSLIDKTYNLVKKIGAQCITITNRDYYFLSRDAQNRASLDGRFILEPFSKNTGPAVALAAKYVIKNYDDIPILVLPADHLIENFSEFNEAINRAITLALNDRLVTFGIIPNEPNTGYGYIKCGENLLSGKSVLKFIEKPNRLDAELFIKSGDYLWNSGIFCFKPSVLLKEFQKYQPELTGFIETCIENFDNNQAQDFVEVSSLNYANVENVSIDCALLECSDKVAVIPSKFTWRDVGSWTSVRELLSSDLDGNRSIGDTLFLDSTNNFVKSGSNRLISMLGLHGLVVIDTPDAILIMNENRAQDVKLIVDYLRIKKHKSLTEHVKVSRPWGTYTVLDSGDGYKIKRIEVQPGASLSLQMHLHRSEHWVVVSGVARITVGINEVEVGPNESTYIAAGKKHRLKNPGEKICVMIEVQCGGYLGEDDIVRFDDCYGRDSIVLDKNIFDK